MRSLHLVVAFAESPTFDLGNLGRCLGEAGRRAGRVPIIALLARQAAPLAELPAPPVSWHQGIQLELV